ncbi:MAG: hypothetical protein LH609_18380 [Rudanella sp.]|nr:hypothetical protein [Rudanella sp.]
MATQNSIKQNREKKPFFFTVKNASGRDIEAFIPAGYSPTEDPADKHFIVSNLKYKLGSLFVGNP